MIEIDALRKTLGGTVVVDDLTLRVCRGELLVLLGHSGCGKTTTLKMINRLVEPTSGAVRIGGTDVTAVAPHELRRRIGYCFQRVGLFPHFTVAENVAVTPALAGWARTRIAHRVDELLELVELEPAAFRERYPGELSGGEQQRVGVARALAAEPAVMLLDEPFGALDPLTRDRLQQSFQAIRRRIDLTAIFVTHDMVEALLLGDRIAVMRRGQLVQVGTPHALLSEPADAYVAELMATPSRQTDALAALRRGTPANTGPA
jgi:osmoprotectant transport system ATP-binding protein